jgi:ribose transport system substrate-binding protein
MVFRRHVIMIAGRTDSDFWKKVWEGAHDEGLAHDAVIEFVGPSSDADPDTAAYWIDYASAARVHGILAYAEDTPAVRAALDAAALRGIPVVTLQDDLVHPARKSFSGVSAWSLGRLIGGLIRDAVGTTGNAVVLLEGASKRAQEQVMMSGIRSALAEHPGIGVSTLYPRAGEASPAEAVRRRLVADDSLEAIICLGVDDALRSVRTVTDLGRTDRVSVIAYGESPEILEYARKGLVHAVIVPDAEEMGRNAASELFSYLETGNANDYVPANLRITSGSNAEARQP